MCVTWVKKGYVMSAYSSFVEKFFVEALKSLALEQTSVDTKCRIPKLAGLALLRVVRICVFSGKSSAKELLQMINPLTGKLFDVDETLFCIQSITYSVPLLPRSPPLTPLWIHVCHDSIKPGSHKTSLINFPKCTRNAMRCDHTSLNRT